MWFPFAWKKGLMAMNFLLVRGMKRYGNKRSMQMKSTTERASGKSIFILNRKWRLECVTNKAKRGKKSGVFLGYLNFTWGELWVRVNHSIFDFLIAFFRTCWKVKSKSVHSERVSSQWRDWFKIWRGTTAEKKQKQSNKW